MKLFTQFFMWLGALLLLVAALAAPRAAAGDCIKSCSYDNVVCQSGCFDAAQCVEWASCELDLYVPRVCLCGPAAVAVAVAADADAALPPRCSCARVCRCCCAPQPEPGGVGPEQQPLVCLRSDDCRHELPARGAARRYAALLVTDRSDGGLWRARATKHPPCATGDCFSMALSRMIAAASRTCGLLRVCCDGITVSIVSLWRDAWRRRCHTALSCACACVCVCRLTCL